jgi:threonine/homoserine/homoserine lactone efflux protein
MAIERPASNRLDAPSGSGHANAMPDGAALVSFILAGLLLNLTPGPDVLYIVARSTSQGRAAGVVSVLGIVSGCLVHIVAAAAGLSALMVKVPIAYQIVRWAGAAYLVWLGLRALLPSLLQRRGPLELQAVAAQPLRRIYWQGVVTNALNPKVALFFVAFLPQFTDPARGSLVLQFLVLGLIFNLNSLWVNLGYALAAAHLGGWLRRRFGLGAALQKLTGAVYLALGVRLLLPDRR